MDPLSITAGTISILSLAARLAFSINTIVDEVRNAPKELGDLKDEIQSLRDIVAQFDSATEMREAQQSEHASGTAQTSSSSRSPEVARLLDRIVDTLKEVEKSIISLQSSLRKSRLGKAKILFTWPLSQRSKFQNLQVSLRNEKLSLILMLQVSTLNAVSKARPASEIYTQAVPEARIGISTVRHSGPDARKDDCDEQDEVERTEAMTENPTSRREDGAVSGVSSPTTQGQPLQGQSFDLEIHSNMDDFLQRFRRQD